MNSRRAGKPARTIHQVASYKIFSDLTGWLSVRSGRIEKPRGYIASHVQADDKVVVYQYDGKEFRGIVVLTEVHTSGNKVRVRSGDVILNVDEKQVAKDD
jgi:phage baseplate assembly protein gpV